ncbi:substrate-binding periplasmic protein [Roseibium sp. M-1]
MTIWHLTGLLYRIVFTRAKWLVTALLLSLPFLQISPATANPVRIAVGEWPPYFSEEATGFGTYAQVVTKAFELEGLDVEYGFFPWKRALLETQEGRWDASAGWGRTSEREPFFHFCDAVLMEFEQFFYAVDRPVSAKDMSDLEGLSLGVIEGAALGEDLDRLVSKGTVTITRQATLEDLFIMLNVGRIDLVMSNGEVAADSISKAFQGGGAERFRPLTDVAVEWDYRVIVSKKIEKGEELCTRFNHGLKALRDSGEYDRLLWPEQIKEDNGENSPS